MKPCPCGSYAINPHHHGRDPEVDLDLCDVCYWRKRAVGPRSVARTERGWAAHLCVSQDCRFRRNTLLGYGGTRIIVSTVGNYFPQHTGKLTTVGWGRHYETYVFRAALEGPYWEISGSEIDSEGLLGGEPDSDLKADAMHERMVEKVTRILAETGRYE